MLKTSDDFFVCEHGCGRLRLAPIMSDLPLARRVNTRKWQIDGYVGRWKYAVGQHKNALGRSPGRGVVVAQCLPTDKSKRPVARAFQFAGPFSESA